MKMSQSFALPYEHYGGKGKVWLNLFNNATKADSSGGTSFDTSKLVFHFF